MPKVVNKEDRREEICGAALQILARGGENALTLRSLAEELNGSITLITHFFANRADLFEAIVEDLLSDWRSDSELFRSDDDWENLRTLLLWMVPLDSSDVAREASRLALIPARERSKGIDGFFINMEILAREQLARALAPLVEGSELNRAIDYLRATVNGIVLSIVEHPARWPEEKRLEVVDLSVQAVRCLFGRNRDEMSIRG